MIELLPTDRLLLRMPSWLGDFVMAEPIARAADRAVREGRIAAASLAAPARWLTLFEGRFPHLTRLPIDAAVPVSASTDTLVRTDAPVESQTRADTSALLAPALASSRSPHIAWRNHTIAILLDGSLRSAIAAWRAGIPERIGLARGGRAPFLTRGVRPALERGATPLGIGRPGRWPRFLPRPFGSVAAELAAFAGLEVTGRRPRIVPTSAGLAAARQRLARLGVGEAYVLVNAGGRPGSAKAMPPEVLAPILADLAREGRQLLLVCGPGEQANAEATLALLTDYRGARERLFDACTPPPSLAELVALIAGACLVVTPDSGPRHLATALERPLDIAFGPTDLRHTADHISQSSLHRREVVCGPCHTENCTVIGAQHLGCWSRISTGKRSSGRIPIS